MSPDLVIRGGPRQSGIYHLVNGGQVVYVGQSAHVLQRVAQHSSIAFDEARIYLCPESELNERERADIARLQPAANSAGVRWPYHGMTRAPRAIRHYGEVFLSREAFIRSLSHVKKGDLRRCGLIKRADDLSVLLSQGFPPPTAQNGRRAYWSASDVLIWLEQKRAA